MAGVFYARIPKDMETQVINRCLDKMNDFTPTQRAMLDAEFDAYKSRCEVDEPVLPYYVWVLVCWEIYIGGGPSGEEGG